MLDLDVHTLKNVATRALKYLIEGLAVALAAYYIPKRRMRLDEIVTIAITAAAIFSVLDVLAPSIAKSARTGVGLGIGVMNVA
jgi:hypothetical protein